MEVVKAMRFRFVRYCVNKAYADLDVQGLPAEVLNVLDDVVNQIRDLERYFTSVDSIVRTLRVDLVKRLKVLRERDPELARRLVERIVHYCNDLEEVVNSPIRPVLDEVLKAL